MKNILLPTDFSENSWNAIRYAIQFFNETSCNFYLLHVDDNLTRSLNKQNETSTDKLNAFLTKITNNQKVKNHHFSTISEHHSFVESIRKQVDENAIDYIVMGTKGASGIKKIILGSNTADVITRVKCNTLIVPEKANYEEIKQVAFPTDYSVEYNLQVLQPLSDILQKTKAGLNILHVSNESEILNTNQINNKSLLEEYFKHIKHKFHHIINKNIEETIETFAECKDVNLIAMIAKNLNFFQQLFFRSKIKEVSFQTAIPFLVLHE